jgi:hypothetical protein
MLYFSPDVFPEPRPISLGHRRTSSDIWRYLLRRFYLIVLGTALDALLLEELLEPVLGQGIGGHGTVGSGHGLGGDVG